MIFDIDPDEGLGFEDVKKAAFDIRDILGALGLQSWPLLSGGKGVHVVVPLVPRADWEAVKGFCQDFAELLAMTDPARFVANMSKAKRKGRSFSTTCGMGRDRPLYALGPLGRARELPVRYR
jgi:bifunctional non-homologous end joining protein LigD